MDKSVMVMEVPGKRRRGRSQRMRLDNIRNDMSEIELSEEEVRERVKKHRPDIKVGKNAEEAEEVFVHSS